MENLLELFLLFLPSWFANATPVLFGGGKRIDDVLGIRVFGSHKTVRGFLSGVLAGTASAVLLKYFFPWAFSSLSIGAWAWGLVLGFSAMIGDLLGSFLKRRLGMKEGEEWFPDTFLFFLTTLIAGGLVNPELILSNIPEVFLLFMLTIVAHRAFNVLANAMNLKGVPW